jgi:hypothetical protein
VSQQIWQLGDIRRDAPGLVTRKQLGRRAPAGLVLEIDVSEHLLVGVTDDDAGVLRCTGRNLHSADQSDKKGPGASLAHLPERV